MARISAHELIDPHGPLESVLFPGTQSNTLAARVEGWITRAYDDARMPAVSSTVTEAMRNQLARALALHFAYTSVVQRMSAQPLSVDVDEKGSTEYDIKQVQMFKELADGYLVEFSDLLPVPTFDPLPGSGSVRLFLSA